MVIYHFSDTTHISGILLYDIYMQNVLHCYKIEREIHSIASAICNDRGHTSDRRQKIFLCFLQMHHIYIGPKLNKPKSFQTR